MPKFVVLSPSVVCSVKAKSSEERTLVNDVDMVPEAEDSITAHSRSPNLQLPTHLQNTPALRKYVPPVGNVFEDMVGNNEVEGVVLKRERSLGQVPLDIRLAVVKGIKVNDVGP